MDFVHPGHQNFNMVLNIMIGIKKSVDASLDIPMYQPSEKDYRIKCMYEIAPYRTSSEDTVKACTFYDYAPQIFANIRKKNNIKKEQYSDSLGPE
jgi:1-phosphatidylinositol-4-phosphate 5-kinase